MDVILDSPEALVQLAKLESEKLDYSVTGYLAKKEIKCNIVFNNINTNYYGSLCY